MGPSGCTRARTAGNVDNAPILESYLKRTPRFHVRGAPDQGHSLARQRKQPALDSGPTMFTIRLWQLSRQPAPSFIRVTEGIVVFPVALSTTIRPFTRTLLPRRPSAYSDRKRQPESPGRPCSAFPKNYLETGHCFALNFPVSGLNPGTGPPGAGVKRC